MASAQPVDQQQDWTKNLGLIASLMVPLALGMIHMGRGKTNEALVNALKGHAMEGAEQGGSIPMFRAMSKSPDPAAVQPLGVYRHNLIPTEHSISDSGALMNLGGDKAQYVLDRHPSDTIKPLLPLNHSLSDPQTPSSVKSIYRSDVFQPGKQLENQISPIDPSGLPEYLSQIFGRIGGQENPQAIAYRRMLEMLSGGI